MQYIRDLLALAGTGLLTFGAWTLAPWAGAMLLGALLLTAAILWHRTARQVRK